MRYYLLNLYLRRVLMAVSVDALCFVFAAAVVLVPARARLPRPRSTRSRPRAACRQLRRPLLHGRLRAHHARQRPPHGRERLRRDGHGLRARAGRVLLAADPAAGDGGAGAYRRDLLPAAARRPTRVPHGLGAAALLAARARDRHQRPRARDRQGDARARQPRRPAGRLPLRRDRPTSGRPSMACRCSARSTRSRRSSTTSGSTGSWSPPRAAASTSRRRSCSPRSWAAATSSRASRSTSASPGASTCATCGRAT